MNIPELLNLIPIRTIEKYLVSLGYVKGTKEYYLAFDTEVAFRRKFGGM